MVKSSSDSFCNQCPHWVTVKISYIFIFYILVQFKRGKTYSLQFAVCGHFCMLLKEMDFETILHLRMYFFYKIDRSEKCPLIFVWCILKFKCSECETSQTTQSASKTISLNKMLISSLWNISIFCALQDIRFIHMTFTGVAFKIYFILYETILLVIMIYILRIMIFLCLTRCSLTVYMSYI